MGLAGSSSHASVVGFKLLSTGRRLLSMDYSAEGVVAMEDENEMVEHMLWNASWAAAGEPCRSLVHAHRINETMGVMDRWVQFATPVLPLPVLQQCVLPQCVLPQCVLPQCVLHAAVDRSDGVCSNE